MSLVATIPFDSYEMSVPEALDACGAREALAGFDTVLVKPNLVGDSPFPVTTHVKMVEAALVWLAANTPARPVIAEGTGDADLETAQIFERLGYADLARRLDVDLVDLNHCESVRVDLPGGAAFSELFLPRIAMESAVVSLPVLKKHSLAGVTGAIKNMMGLLPPKHYSGSGGTWKKAVFHHRMQASLSDLAACRLPEVSLLDASRGLAEFHLGGAELDPPPGVLLASTDAYAVDRAAAGLLGLDWLSVGHLRRPGEAGENA